jgi:transposase InsO family protein
VFFVLAHHRRRVLHFNVTANPTARWTAQQVVEAFPWTDPPKYLLRDRDKIYGETFRSRVTGMGFEEVLTAARSPWQNPFAERLVGSIRRECLDHVIVFDEMHLRRILKSYFRYYHEWRVHQSLEMDCPEMICVSTFPFSWPRHEIPNPGPTSRLPVHRSHLSTI